MNLVIFAIPLFILAIGLELAWGLASGRNTYRLNDSVGSLSLGVLSQARGFVTLGVGGYFYYLLTQYFSLPLMDNTSWFTWVFATLLYDFCYYWQHRLGHERTILWAAHVAHHQSEDYNLTTALRQTSTGFLLGWIFYLPMYFFGVPAEVIVTVGSLNLIYQFWVHTEHVPKLGWYERFFVTPSNHRVHHAQNDVYLDRNYGGLLIIWDRLFGTFQEELEDEPVVYGIRGPLRSFGPVKALTHIYVEMARDSWRTRRWRDKLHVWVARTGWRPEDVAEAYPRQKNALSSFQKYDPQVPATVSWYAFCQLLVIIAVLAYMQRAEPGYWLGVCLWGVILATAATTALWLDARGRQLILNWELVRLCAVGLLLVIAWRGETDPRLVQMGGVYVLANLLGLLLLWRRQVTPDFNTELVDTAAAE